MTLFSTGEVRVNSSRALTSLTSIVFAAFLLFAVPAQAQQTGDIAGVVTDAYGNGISGVTIEASSNILPQPRSTTSAANGRYRLRLLPPGQYEVDVSYPDGTSQTYQVMVLLQQTADLHIVSGEVIEEITVTGQQIVAGVTNATLGNAISAETIDAIPTGQDYRDMMKLIPGVQYTEFNVRGPSAGGSGQDNIYQFDGVDVSLPLFGVLGSEPSSHDIDQVTVIRGGAKAVGFNRSGGFLMNTTSKRGTNEFQAEVGYQLQSSSMTANQDQETSARLEYDQDRMWLTANVGGPVIQDRLYFYASFYRPEYDRANSANEYGPVGNYDNVRDEAFGKLTFQPTEDILLDASFRTSDREVANSSIGATGAPSTALGSAATQDILILEGSWITSDDSALSFKYVDWEETGSSIPDTLMGFTPGIGGNLNLGALETMGNFFVPTYRDEADPDDGADNAMFNTFAQSFIDAYSYQSCAFADSGCGGGNVGGHSQIDESAYTRESFEIAFDHTVYAGDVTHEFHIGYKYEEVGEDLIRNSNGWGAIYLMGGITPVDLDLDDDGTDDVTINPYFRAVVPQSLRAEASAINSIYSSSELQSFEINDTITAGDWTFNVGLMVSNDVLFGQGLRPNPNNPATGFELAPGHPYEMYEVDWKDTLQPRLGIQYDYSDTGSVYANFAKYHPPASSLARAASWDRNLRPIVDVYWDANGNYLESLERASSSGKWFQEGIEPRFVDEFLIGMTKDYSDRLSMRTHVRHRKAADFWEDTWNWSRTYSSTNGRPGDAPSNIPNEPYIPADEFAALRAEVGGSSYVIAALDGAYTKYWEWSTEVEWDNDNWWLSGSYTWSHYYGNFDQDNTSGGNDAALFIGSSNLADGRGRQLWDMKHGDLKGDRRHVLKVYGHYRAPWDGRFGAYALYQSGEPWETWDGSLYGFSSSTIRYSEPAGSNRGPSHWQLDLNYTHYFQVADQHRIEARVDLYNAFDNQSGYNINPYASSSTYAEPRNFYRPRTVQLKVTYQFN